jgi:hypothetical protein
MSEFAPELPVTRVLQVSTPRGQEQLVTGSPGTFARALRCQLVDSSFFNRHCFHCPGCAQKVLIYMSDITGSTLLFGCGSPAPRFRLPVDSAY